MNPRIFTLTALLLAFFTSYCQTYTQGRLTVTAQDHVYRDSFRCQGKVDHFYTVTVNNATLNDVVKIYNTPYTSAREQVVNSAGASTFTFNPSGNYYEYKSEYYVQNDSLFFVSPGDRFICGTDTVTLPGYPVHLYCPNPCVFDTVFTIRYFDLPGNCGPKGNNPTCNAYILATDSVYYGYGPTANEIRSISQGFWDMTIYQKSFRKSMTVSIEPVYQFLFPNSNCVTPVYTFPGQTTLLDTFFYPFKPSTNVDVRVWLGNSGVVRPVVPFMLYPRVSNLGYNGVSGKLYVVLPQHVVYDSTLSVNLPNSHSGDTLIWNFTNLSNNSTSSLYFNNSFPAIHLTPDGTVNIGDSLCFQIFTNHNIFNDIDTTNNYQAYCLPVINSFDPNIKQVEPRGDGPGGIIPVTTSDLAYTINFQNTGTAQAINIVVLDTLDSNIDTASLTILGTSHRMTPSWIGNDILKASFNYINLPDSATNEPRSHGNFSFKVKLKPNLIEGTQIKNSAAIYFDNNAPVLTNTVVNTLAVTSGIENATTVPGISVYPNPTNNKVNIVTDNAISSASIRLCNLNGQVVYQLDNLSGSYFTIDMTQQPVGIYFVELKNAEYTWRIKLVKEN